MASQFIIMAALVLSFSVFLPSTLARVICEELPQDLCSLAVSYDGKRCLLESAESSPAAKSHCTTSEVTAEEFANWIESDSCVLACGVDRFARGISSDALFDPKAFPKICTPACFGDCPNIIDLYSNLAAAEGVLLQQLCIAQRLNAGHGFGLAPSPSPSA